MSFPKHRLAEFVLEGRASKKSFMARDFGDAGFPHIWLRMFLNQQQHVWMNLEFPLHMWTGQVVWFNEDDERDRFIERWLYPTFDLWLQGHEHAIQFDPDEAEDVINQMNTLGAGLVLKQEDVFVADCHGMVALHDNGPFPPRNAIWLPCNEDQAMIARMCDQATLKMPITPDPRLGPNVENMTLEESTKVRQRKLVENFGLTGIV